MGAPPAARARLDAERLALRRVFRSLVVVAVALAVLAGCSPAPGRNSAITLRNGGLVIVTGLCPGQVLRDVVVQVRPPAGDTALWSAWLPEPEALAVVDPAALGPEWLSDDQALARVDGRNVYIVSVGADQGGLTKERVIEVDGDVLTALREGEVVTDDGDGKAVVMTAEKFDERSRKDCD